MLNLIFQLLTPDHIKKQPNAYTQAKNMIGTAIIGIVAIPLYAGLYYSLHHVAGAIAILLEGAVITLAMLVLRFTGSLFWTRELIVGSLTLCVVWMSWSLGGLESAVAFWLVLPPLTAFFLGGLRPGIFSGAVCGLAVLILYLLAASNFPLPVSPITNKLVLRAFSILGLMSIIFMLAYFFVRRAFELLEETQQANNQMRAAMESEKHERLGKNLLKNILESSVEYSIVATNLQGDILVWNEGAHRNYGYTKEEVEGKKIDILYTPEDVRSGKSNKFLNAAMTVGKAEGEWERVRKNGTRFLASVVMNLRRNDAGTPVGYVLISKNITSQKLLEAQLIKTNRELEQFAYIASHDLKAPLRAIARLTSWIEEDNADKLDGKSKENLILLRQRVDRMSSLISGILEYSRSGGSDFHAQTVDVRKLLQGIEETLSPSKKFTIIYADNLPVMQTDNILLAQVFSNLIDNSIKHHDKETGVIELGVSDAGKFYKFWVKDDGPGIEPEYHEKIFQIFQTLKSRDEVESTGIGLSIVKKIVESRGGEITVSSEKDKGTTFFFTWPKAPKT